MTKLLRSSYHSFVHLIKKYGTGTSKFKDIMIPITPLPWSTFGQLPLKDRESRSVALDIS